MNMKMLHHEKCELIRQIMRGTVHRVEFPALFKNSITWPGQPTQTITPEPVTIPDESKKRLIRAVVTDTLNECDHSELYENLFEIVINYHGTE
jgi:hypothetical protein